MTTLTSFAVFMSKFKATGLKVQGHHPLEACWIKLLTCKCVSRCIK